MICSGHSRDSGQTRASSKTCTTSLASLCCIFVATKKKKKIYIFLCRQDSTVLRARVWFCLVQQKQRFVWTSMSCAERCTCSRFRSSHPAVVVHEHLSKQLDIHA